ncbi:MAG: transcriptional regulator [Actinomycetota bacterium]
MTNLGRDVKRISTLDDDLRRSMYLFARRQLDGVNREDVAREFGVSRKLAAFHLDKLAGEGLLKFHYARPPGRSGPGAGRPAKVYEPSDVEVEVSLPQRRYDVVGALLVDTITTAAQPGVEHARTIAYEAGLAAGSKVREDRHLRPPGAERAMAVAAEMLEEYGFEPARTDNEVSLKNCPFHALAQHAPELVCIMNQGFLEGVVRGLGNETVKVDLVPTEGQCCVRLRRP